MKQKQHETAPPKLQIRQSWADRAELKRRAGLAGLPVATYLRQLGLGYEPRSSPHVETIGDLHKINADNGRLGGLLKLWLTGRSRGAATAEIRTVLKSIEANQAAMREVMRRL